MPPARIVRLVAAQRTIAREYGFTRWPKLRADVLECAKYSDGSRVPHITGDSFAYYVYRSMVNAFSALRSLTFEVRVSSRSHSDPIPREEFGRIQEIRSGGTDEADESWPRDFDRFETSVERLAGGTP